MPVGASYEMGAALRKLGADVKLTVYPDVGHNAWKPAYNTRGLYRWLLRQRRRPRRRRGR